MKSLAVVLVAFGWVIFCALMTVVSWIGAAISTSRVMSYIKEHEYDKWRELTSVGDYGPGLQNPFRVWAYVQAKGDIEDSHLLDIRGKARLWWRNMFISFIAFVLSMAGFAAFMWLSSLARAR